MLKLHILSRLSRNTRAPYYFSLRKLFSDEVAVAKDCGLKRYCLPQLSSSQESKFFQEFDAFWEQVIHGRDRRESFWRNGVSSKMQEWENSCGYLALSLFTLLVSPVEEEGLVVLPESVEEAEVWRAWAIAHGWMVASYGFGWLQRICQQADNFLRSVRLFVLCVLKKLRASKYLPVIRPGAVLVTTLFYQKSLGTDKYEDQFFGSLHEEIAHFGRDILYVGDAIDEFTRADSMRMGKAGRPVSIYSLVSWLDILAGSLVVFTRAPQFENNTFLGVDFSKVLFWHAHSYRYDFNLTAEIFYRGVHRACRRYQFAKMLYAYEGSVYERAAVQAFREETPAPVDAYSHAVLYSLNLKLHASVSEAELAPEPDRYLVCSEDARNVLYRLRSVKAAMIPTCSLRSISRPGDIKKNDGENVLVVLDGLWSTAVVLDWLYQNADALGGRPVVIRPHPNMGWARLRGQCPNYRAGLFRISQRSLKDDFEDAFCVLYRQSSVGIQALMHGIPIIHLKVDQPLSGDPLKDTDLGKMVVTDAQGLSKALSHVPAVRKEILSADSDTHGFVTGYFVPPRPELLRFFVEIGA